MAGLSRYRAELTSPLDPSDRPRRRGGRLGFDRADEPSLPVGVGMDIVRMRCRELALELPVGGGVPGMRSEPVPEGEVPAFEPAPCQAEMHVEAPLAGQVATGELV